MVCKNCGQPMDEGTRFCKSCGADNAAPAYGAPTGAAPAGTPGKGLGIAGMICGIVAAVFCCWLGIFWYLVLPCGIAGIILSAIGLTQAKNAGSGNGMAVTGLVCSIVGLTIECIWLMIACFGCMMA